MTTNKPIHTPSDPTSALSDEFWRALSAVLDYCWDAEERDYQSSDPRDRAGHVFESLQYLKTYAVKH